MADFDIMAHLGIKKVNNISIANPLHSPSNSLEAHSKLTPNSLEENQDTELDTAESSELSEFQQQKTVTEQTAFFDPDEYRHSPTTPHEIAEAGETGWDNLPEPSPPEIDRSLNVKLRFAKKVIASQWAKELELALAVRTWGPKKILVAGGETQWELEIINLTQEQIDKIEDWDTEDYLPRDFIKVWKYG